MTVAHPIFTESTFAGQLFLKISCAECHKIRQPV